MQLIRKIQGKNALTSAWWEEHENKPHVPKRDMTFPLAPAETLLLCMQLTIYDRLCIHTQPGYSTGQIWIAWYHDFKNWLQSSGLRSYCQVSVHWSIELAIAQFLLENSVRYVVFQGGVVWHVWSTFGSRLPSLMRWSSNSREYRQWQQSPDTVSSWSRDSDYLRPSSVIVSSNWSSKVVCRMLCLPSIT